MSKVAKRGDNEFPERLADVRPEVEKLFWRGSWEEEFFDRCVAVVGSRKMTRWGKKAVEKIVPVLVEAGVTVVSGFMYGVDQAGHKACLQSGGKTIAVLGWGIDKKVAEEDEKLMEEIVERGLVLSEYEGELGAKSYTFPTRNRIVVGLSEAVIVVEAAEGSGSLNSAEWARKFGRKLFAVPGWIGSKVSEGTNGLIKEGEAELITSGQDVLEVMGWERNFDIGFDEESGEVEGLGDEEKEIWEFVKDNQGVDMSEMAWRMAKNASVLSAKIAEMELKGLIVDDEGKYYVK